MAGAQRLLAEKPPLRVGVSLETLAGANVNDARAAYRVWGEEVARNLHMTHSAMLDQVFYTSTQILQMIRSAQIDGVALSGLEYVRAIEYLSPEITVVEDYATSGIDYVLLVHRGSSYQKLEDLKHTRIALLHHRDTSLLKIWLTIALAGVHQPEPDLFFDTVETHEKVNDVILPLYFGKVDAAGISRRAFMLTAELNPQLGRDLRVLSASPKVVPVGFWFRKGCDVVERTEFVQAMVKLRTVTAGRQVLALYQSTGFVMMPNSVMDGTLDLVHQYDRIHKKS